MKYFTIQELTNSDTAKKKGIKNVPNDKELQNLIRLVENVLDPLRETYGKPIVITSGFRSKELNKAVGGAKTSQHTLGEAADIRSVADTKEENMKLFKLAQSLPFDQLINEYDYDWVHISYSDRNRHQILNIK